MMTHAKGGTHTNLDRLASEVVANPNMGQRGALIRNSVSSAAGRTASPPPLPPSSPPSPPAVQDYSGTGIPVNFAEVSQSPTALLPSLNQFNMMYFDQGLRYPDQTIIAVHTNKYAFSFDYGPMKLRRLGAVSEGSADQSASETDAMLHRSKALYSVPTDVALDMAVIANGTSYPYVSHTNLGVSCKYL